MFHLIRLNLEMVMDSIIYSNCKFPYNKDLRFYKVNEFIFKNCIIDGTLNLKSTTDAPVDIKRLSFKDTRNLGRIEINWKANKVKKAIDKNGDNFLSRAEQYAMLKENFHNIGDYESEDLAYVEYKKCAMKSKLLGDHSDRVIKKIIHFCIQLPFYLFQKIIFDWLGGFGTKPGRVFIAILITIFGFAILYLTLPIFDIGLNQEIDLNLYLKIGSHDFELGKFVTSFYYSGITFLTIGYGDISPMNSYTAIACVVEGFLGIFLMSYFTVSFARKLLR